MRFGLVLTILGVVLVPLDARAQSEQADLLREARAAEAEHRPAEAVAIYRRAVTLAPTSRLATTARRRLEHLEARAEGGYAPLAAHLAFRDLVPTERTPARTEVFEAAVRAFPEGRVRREAWALLGETWLTLDRPERAEAAFRALAAEPGATDTERTFGHTGTARALAAQRGAGAGAAHLREVGLTETPTHDTLARESERAVGRVVAGAVIASFALAVLLVGRRELVRPRVLRAAFAPARVAVVALLLATPVALAHLYDHDTLDTFAFLGVGSAGVLACSSLAGEALGARGASLRARIGIAAGAVLAELGVGYLAIDRAGQLLSIS